MALPKWFDTVPENIKPYIEQEYYISPHNAQKMAINCKNYEDIKKFRKSNPCYNKRQSCCSINTVFQLPPITEGNVE